MTASSLLSVDVDNENGSSGRVPMTTTTSSNNNNNNNKRQRDADDSGLVVDDYYNTLRASKRMKNYRGYIDVPDNIDDIIREADGPEISLRKQFIVFASLLNNISQKMVKEKRVMNLKRKLLSEEDDDLNRATSASPPPHKKSKLRRSSSCSSTESFTARDKMSKTEAFIYDKVKTRQSMVPVEMYKCCSPGARFATALFCLHDYKKEISIKSIIAIHGNRYRTVKDVIELSSRSIYDIGEELKSVDTESFKDLPEEFRKNVCLSILSIANLLCDKNITYILVRMDYDMYLKAAVLAADKCAYTSIEPYNALIAMFLKLGVELRNKNRKNKEIQNQFKVNPKDTMMLILNNLKSFREDELSNKRLLETSKNSVKNQMRFDPDITYHVFEGPLHFDSHVSMAYKIVNGETFQVKYYKNCVFDVMGKNDRLFYDKNWKERLDEIDVTPKVVIKKLTGVQLNEIDDNRSLGVSWMEDGKTYYKTFNITKSRKTKE